MKNKQEKEPIRYSIATKRAEYTKLRRRVYLAFKRNDNRSGNRSLNPYEISNYTSYALSELSNGDRYYVKSKKRKQLDIDIPQKFSLIDNPEKVMFFLTWLAGEMRKQPISVHVNHATMRSCDLLSESLLDFMLTELKKESNKSVRFSGVLPKNENLQKFLRAIGIIRALDIQTRKPTDDENKQLEVFFKDGSSIDEVISSGSNTRNEIIARDFAIHINKCLSRAKKKLTDAAEQNLINYVGEILDNIRQHSGRQDWGIKGYLNVADMQCEIAIYNFGPTIFDSFNTLAKSSYPWKKMLPYIEMHLGQNDLSEEELVTVFALQQGVSSKNTDENTTRGQGTIDLLTFFKNIYDELQNSPLIKDVQGCQMAIVSGHTHIYFNNSNILSYDGKGRQIAPLNKAKTLSAPPEREHVTCLKNSLFPGTAIGIKFAMPLDSTSEQHNETKEN